MTLTHRRITYFIFIAVFVVILPFIILHANGYRFNFKKSVLQKTGIIFLESKPKKAMVWLNDKLIEDKTPVRIKNLLPNEYKIKLTKEGYKEWEKKIKIYQGQTTFLQYVRLFKDGALPKLLMEGEIKQIDQGNDKNKLLILKQENNKYFVKFFELSDMEERDIFESKNAIESVKLIDNDSRAAIWTADNNIWLVEITDKENAVNLQKELGGRALPYNLKLDEYNSNNIYYLEYGKLVRFNLVNKNKTVFPYLMADYKVRDSFIYFLSNDSLNKTFLKKVDIFDLENVENLLSLKRSADYKIIEVMENRVIIRNKDSLILWDEENSEKEIIERVNYYLWNKDYSEMLFGNNWELWSYRPGEKDNYVLFTRLGETIEEVNWYQPETHIFYVAGSKIKIIENLASNRCTTEIAEIEGIKNLMVNKKGDKIYFIGQLNEQKGLYELEIQ